jgi:glucan phosphoethanolaminetransferase (alkaline phosphatase superfamily)
MATYPRKIRAIYAVITLIALIMMPNLVWLWVGHGLNVWICGLVIPAVLLMVLFAVFGNWPWFACLLLAPFSALAPLEAFYISTYLRPTSAEILATMVATNPREAREYLGYGLWPLVLCLVAGLLLALLTAWWSWRSRLRWSHRSRAWVLAIAILLPLAAFVTAAITTPGSAVKRASNGMSLLAAFDEPVVSGYPFGLLPRIMDYRQQWRQMRDDSARLNAFRFHVHRVSTIGKRQVYVLVIGEASRRDHWQLFGYQRATNPQLTAVSNLVPIPDMVTSWPESITAIPLILTRKPITDSSLAWKEASILRAMKEAGFDTYWISNQLAIGEFDSPVSTYAYEAEHLLFLNHATYSAPGSYDGVLLQPLRDALNDSPNDLFVVLHMMGSHSTYDYRYPASFKQFQPTQIDSSEGSQYERTRNSYDNSILYTDHVLAQIIGILRDSGTVSALFFESDHGEALPSQTCSLKFHGNGTRYEYQIPALFWYSDSYSTSFPGRVATLRTNADRQTLSADTFESLIDMTGLNFPGHDESQSLFSPQWHYRPRTINSPWHVNIDQAKFTKGCGFALPLDE